MKRFDIINDEQQLWPGAVIRLFGVKRMDIMKLTSDFNDPKKQKSDYYDLLIVRTSIIADNAFMLINITNNSDNRGAIYSIVKNKEQLNYIKAKEIKDYFDETDKLFLIDRGEIIPV